MTFTYQIKGETPPKKNSRITLRNGRTIPSKNYTAWRADALRQLEEQIKPITPLIEPCEITFIFVHGDKRRRDSDNQISSILDVFQDSNILEDDNWNIVNKYHVENHYLKNLPSVTVEIKSL